LTLTEFFKDNPKAALGFSGGVDSAYLLYAGVRAGADIRPYFIKTAFQPAFELTDAQRLTEQLGVKLRVIEHDIFQNAAVIANPADRCYHCKTVLFSLLGAQAQTDGYALLLDGTNASDDVGDRPGMRALKELKVLSPLRECMLTKAKIRELSKQAGLFTWNKPAYACLATRVSMGEPLTAELLQKVEQAENKLFQMGFSDFRARVFHGAARIQLPENQIVRAAEQKNDVLNALKPWFETVLLDLKGRNQ